MRRTAVHPSDDEPLETSDGRTTDRGPSEPLQMRLRLINVRGGHTSFRHNLLEAIAVLINRA